MRYITAEMPDPQPIIDNLKKSLPPIIAALDSARQMSDSMKKQQRSTSRKTQLAQ
jgi:hypothetical protein